jgi:SH3 domain protein
MRRFLCAAALLAWTASAAAETAYVTDLLRLGITSSSDGSGPSFDTLKSGDALEVLARSGSYAHVRLADGRDGWVKAAFIVTEKPARLRMSEAEAAVGSMRDELAAANAGREKAEQELARFKEQREADASSSKDARELLAQMRRENDEYESRLDGYRHSLPLPWVAAALAVTLVAGFLGGWWWLDASIRRRYGGFRIY